VKKLILISALSAFALVTSPAIAGRVKLPAPIITPAPIVIAPSLYDVTLGGTAANSFAPLGDLNPQGKAGDPAVTGAFGGDWSAIGGYKGSIDTDPHGEIVTPLAFGLTTTIAKGDDWIGGGWSVANTSKTHNISLDLVFAMHAGGKGGAWLFSERTLLAGEQLDGAWVQRMLNGGGQVGGYSNVTFFARNLEMTKITPPPDDTTKDLPEPATLGSLLLGLGMLGFMGRRRKPS
jgi:hypothetical protein